MKKNLVLIIVLVIALIATAKVVSLVIENAPAQQEELVTVVETYDNVVTVERADGNIYSCYGTTNETVLVAEFSGDELVDLNSVSNYTIGEIKELCNDTYFIIKNSHLDKLNPDDYQDSQCVSVGIIDDIDTFGYCFFI